MIQRFASVVVAGMAFAQAALAQQNIAPLPFGQQQAQSGIYSTRDAPPPPQQQQQAPSFAQPLPWQNVTPPAPVLVQPSPFAPAESAPTSAPPPAAQYIPFQRATPYGGQAVPGPLPMNRAVPVENIDAIEVSEPAAAAPTTFEANPAEEDPAAPTELTAPMFAANADSSTPRTVVLRVLNKVTAQGQLLKIKPGAVADFGRLKIEALQCYQSAPTSQSDTVALLSIRETLPGKDQTKLLFYGWMYASSPSLTALEHPVYDVTMVDCRMKTKPVDAVDNAAKAAEKSGEKQAGAAKNKAN